MSKTREAIERIEAEYKARLERHRNRAFPVRVLAARPRFLIAILVGCAAGFFTPEAWDDIRLKSAETMRAAMVGPRPQNVITPDMF